MDTKKANPKDMKNIRMQNVSIMHAKNDAKNQYSNSITYAMSHQF